MLRREYITAGRSRLAMMFRMMSVRAMVRFMVISDAAVIVGESCRFGPKRYCSYVSLLLTVPLCSTVTLQNLQPLTLYHHMTPLSNSNHLFGQKQRSSYYLHNSQI